MINRITIGGRITADPELKQTNSGASVTSFTIACDRDFKDKDGEKCVDFVTIVAWRQTAEFVCKYFSKGRMILVDGRLQIRNWKDKDGNGRYAAEVVAENVYFGDSKRDEGNAPNNSAPAYGGGYGATAGGGFAEIADEDENLPF